MDENISRQGLLKHPTFWLLIGAVTIIAFSLGALLSGGGDSSSSSATLESQETSRQSEVWTCSMHPQIKLPKSGKCPICFMDLIPLSIDRGDELGPRQLRMSESARKLARIETTPVIRGRAQGELRLYGKLAIEESRLSKITARASGRIDRLYLNSTGMTVARGDKVMEIYSPELLSAQKELVQAKSSLTTLAESRSDILKSTAEATVRAAAEKLRLLGFTEHQVAEIESQSDVSEHITVRAQDSGIVIEKMVVEGQYVEPGMELFSVADLSQLWVLMEAYESDLPLLNIGEVVSFTTSSFPDERFEARITFINPTVDPMTRTVSVRAQVDNRRVRLKPDMFVAAVLSTEVDQGGDSDGAPLLVPASAVLVTGKRAIVYVEVPGNDEALFEGREIEIGPRVSDHYVVRSGLSEGDMVVTNGAFKLDSELQIQAKPSMMSLQASSGTEHHANDRQSAGGSDGKVSQAARDALTRLYEAYFVFQMALAADDLAVARKSAGALAEVVDAVDMTLFTDAAHDDWMRLSRDLLKQSEAASNAVDIEGARGVFFYLSIAILELHERFGHTTAKNYYLTYCPMARDNKGAYWLQAVDTVYNSFYGAAMLRCGEIKQALKAETKP